VAADLGIVGAAKRQRLSHIRDRKGYWAFLASRGLSEDPSQSETSRRIGRNQ
jgi:hypothetical protein